MSEYPGKNEYSDELMLALETGFVNSKVKSSERLQPRILLNDPSNNSKVIAHITRELEKCDEFNFAVAFITDDGLTLLLNSLKLLQSKKISGKILTSDYLYFNNPKVFKRLLNLQDTLLFESNGKMEKTIEVRIFDKASFHAKGYLFHRNLESTLIVGSSNLTQKALMQNHEWNLKVSSLSNGSLVQEVQNEFDKCWKFAKPLTFEWITNYELKFCEKNIIDATKSIKYKKDFDITLNKMQRKALEALAKLRNENESKALIISATGTGKTYLAAFDVESVRPDKFLFVIHRENVAAKAMESFKKIIGTGKTMSLFTGNHKNIDSDYIFATIQSISKDDQMRTFSPDHFDYIVIDEVHRAGSATYIKVINYFKPKFLLGMSATPERNDDFDIYKTFDNNIAYEIRLRQALEEDMLCPFHYFGISEISIDGIVLDEKSDFVKLTSEERVKHILDNIVYYGYSGGRAKGLIFCSRNDEAKLLSEKFNELGYKTVALSGESTEEDREESIIRLEQDGTDNCLDYIFTVDIFNEGVDIPLVNQIIMLRPTQSSIIFIQQLGRGLRKAYNKEFVIVLDFIGNYSNNYMIPLALSGDRTYNKDTMRLFIQEGNNIIPGCSTINFDKIAKKRIFDSIESARFSQIKLLKDEYKNMKRVVGRVPTINDFYDFGEMDPELFHKKVESFYKFCVQYDTDYKIRLSEPEEILLKFATSEFADGKRPHEMIILTEIIKNGRTDLESINKLLLNEYEIKNDEDSIRSAALLLSDGFLQKSYRKRYTGISFINRDGDRYAPTEYFKEAIKDDVFKLLFNDILTYINKKYKNSFNNRYNNSNLVLFQKYSRKDACRLLNWQDDESSTVYGYKIKYDTCPIFVTYEKKSDINYTIKYQDEFVDRGKFSWMTRNKVRVNSPEALKVIGQINNGLKIHLFVKKKDGESRDHYYLGELKYLEHAETTISGDNIDLPIVNFQFAININVRDDIYDYFVNQ